MDSYETSFFIDENINRFENVFGVKADIIKLCAATKDGLDFPTFERNMRSREIEIIFDEKVPVGKLVVLNKRYSVSELTTTEWENQTKAAPLKDMLKLKDFLREHSEPFDVLDNE